MELKSVLKDKKGMGIGDIYPVILTITVVAILLGVVMMVFGEWQDTTNTTTGSVNNETGIAINDTTYTVAKATECGFNEFSVSTVLNATDNTTVLSGNYTTDADAGTIVGASGRTSNWTTAKVTYSYEYGEEDCEALSSVTEDFTDFIPWIGIILLIVAAAIVLGIVIRSFKGNRV